MIALIAADAFAQGNSELVGAGRDCILPAAIYGTSGWANAQQALDTNASTYSAAAFAETLGLDEPYDHEDGGPRGLVVWEVNQTWNVARVPSFHGGAGQNYIEETDCAPEYLVGFRPVDLQATLLAGVIGSETVGVFFAASQTSGQVSESDGIVRPIVGGYLYPLYSTLSLPFAPFLAGEYRSGAGGVGLDAVYGAWLDTTFVRAKAGYTKSNGFYATARDTTVGLFATAVFRPNDGSVPVFRAGVQRFDPGQGGGESAEKFGMPSAIYRDIPLAQPIGVDDSAGVVHQRLRTTHLQLEDMGRMVDVASTFRLRPEATVSEGLAAVHTSRYNRRPSDDVEEKVGFAYAQAGYVSLLEQPSLGVPGGVVPSVRLEAGYRSLGANLWFHLQFNDPEQLALFPFARNALSVQYHVEVTRW